MWKKLGFSHIYQTPFAQKLNVLQLKKSFTEELGVPLHACRNTDNALEKDSMPCAWPNCMRVQLEDFCCSQRLRGAAFDFFCNTHNHHAAGLHAAEKSSVYSPHSQVIFSDCLACRVAYERVVTQSWLQVVTHANHDWVATTGTQCHSLACAPASGGK